MNILLTSVGRRSYLVEYFKEAFNAERLIYTSNSEMTYTMKLSDGYFISPLIYQDDYVDQIIEFCKKKNITVVTSLFDIDLLVLAQNEQIFSDNGILLLLAPVNSIEICNDKWLTYRAVLSSGLKTPKTYKSLSEVENALEKKEVAFPLILKPRWGMASLGLYIIYNEDELTVLYKRSEKEIFNSYLKYESSSTPEEPIIIQELLVGQEFGVDILNDLNNKFVACFAKQKVRMRAGETDLGLTVNSKPFEEISSVVSKKINHKGILSMDCFIVNDEIYITEFNCRISGHYPISHVSGFNYPMVLKAWLNGITDIDSLLNFEENVYVCKDLSVRRLD